MFRYLAILWLCMITGSAPAAVFLNEVMVNPVGGDHANCFLELRITGNDTISMNGYRIEFAGVQHWLIQQPEVRFVAPGYALIVPGAYPEIGGRYEEFVPDSIARFRITNPYFGAALIDPAVSHTVLLYDSSSVMIDSVRTSPALQRGFSEERILANSTGSDSNWQWSTRSDGTPGVRNTATPIPLDLGMVTCSFYPPPGNTRNPSFFVQINGNGEYPLSSQFVLKFRRLPQQALVEIARIAVPALSYREHWQIEAPADSIDSQVGWVSYFAELSHRDSITTNDSLSGFACHWSPVFPIITEWMARSAPGQPGWFELLWQGDRLAQFGDWKIVVDGDSIPLPFHNALFAMDTRFVVASAELPLEYNVNSNLVLIPELWRNWGSRGANVELVAPWGEVIERLPFGSRFPVEPVIGKSLVRRSLSIPADIASNWYVSRDSLGAAPGRVDSPDSVVVTPTPVVTGNRVELPSKRFAPQGASGLPTELPIMVETAGGDWRVEIIDMAGRRRWEQKLRLPAGNHSVPWKGVDQSGDLVATGVYLVQVFWNDHRVFRSSCVVVR